ncbi:MAG TPA: hypothetical protein VKC34_00075 [Blastocatellia bacterium]|nr:hypothetical protein [Blastocatellia bacterium]
MSIFCRLLRKHYWGTPHRASGDRLVQVCYECGAERPASDLYKEVAHWHSCEPRTGRMNKVIKRQLAEEPVAVVVSTGQVVGSEFKGNLSLVKRSA